MKGKRISLGLPQDPPAEFVLNEDGSLEIEVDAGEQGGSEMGWWGAVGRITLSRDDVKKLREFLAT